MKRIGLVLFVGSCAFLGGEAAVSFAPRLQTPANAQQQPVSPPQLPATPEPVRVGERFEEIARKLSPAVVYVEAVKPAKPSAGTGAKNNPTEESGSGVLVRIEGQRNIF